MTTESSTRYSVTGPILVDNACAVNDTGLAQLAAGVSEIDMGGVTEADSSGIAVLLSWLREAKSRKMSLSITNIPASMHSLAAVYGVTELIP